MPDQTHAIDLDAIRQREQAATEGPWQAAWPKGLHPWEVCISADVPLVELAHGEQGIADAEFIAHAREDIPALLAAVEAVLRLHVADSYGDCCECGNVERPHNVPWPCLTVRDIRAAMSKAGA